MPAAGSADGIKLGSRINYATRSVAGEIMKKLARVLGVSLLGACALVTGVQAGGLPTPVETFACNEQGDTHLSRYFCDGLSLYEVSWNCFNLKDDVRGGLEVYTESFGGTGLWAFEVRQNTDETKDDWVCQASGIYGDRLKTEMKCTDAPNGSNKPHPKHGGEHAQADFEIKLVAEKSKECDLKAP